jgi:hypothetical protein
MIKKLFDLWCRPMGSKFDIKVVHTGRSGYLEYDGCTYEIEHRDEGLFCVHFPCGNRHSD